MASVPTPGLSNTIPNSNTPKTKWCNKCMRLKVKARVTEDSSPEFKVIHQLEDTTNHLEMPKLQRIFLEQVMIQWQSTKTFHCLPTIQLHWWNRHSRNQAKLSKDTHQLLMPSVAHWQHQFLAKDIISQFAIKLELISPHQPKASSLILSREWSSTKPWTAKKTKVIFLVKVVR